MMKIGKKKIFLLIVIVMVVISIMFNLRQKVLGNMSDNIKTKQTSSSDFSFSADEGQIIKVSLRTDVKNGTVDFVLTDSKGNVVAELDRARALETYVNIEYSDTYTMTAIYKEFVGNYNIKVSIRRF
ncbi:MAG: hypothetical protein SPF70_04780 [Lachnospiraceae bacterium]|nr:hypothetical protein [Lachnospiraceae bacterium]